MRLEVFALGALQMSVLLLILFIIIIILLFGVVSSVNDVTAELSPDLPVPRY